MRTNGKWFIMATGFIIVIMWKIPIVLTTGPLCWYCDLTILNIEHIFYLQLLKGRHMMVRVGGGWDTLEHFLARHDPCQSQHRTPTSSVSSRNSSPLSQSRQLGLSQTQLSQGASTPQSRIPTLSRNSTPSPSPVSSRSRSSSKGFLATYQDTLVAR